MKTSHTPGPWQPLQGRPGLIFSQDQAVAQCCEPFLRENSRLIATAPELLKALIAAVEWGAPMSEAPKSSRPEWFDLARAAIAKATNV